MLAITFDLDGTLATVGRRKLGLWRGALRHPRVLPAFAEVVEGLRGERHADLDAEIARRLSRKSGRPQAEVRAVLADWIDTRWPRLFAGAHPPRPVAALIDRCDALGLPRAVISDHPPDAKLAAMGLGGWALTIGCRQLGALKPLPDALHAAAAGLGVPVNRILHVGDRPETDGAMAAAAGASFVSVAELLDGVRPLPDPA